MNTRTWSDDHLITAVQTSLSWSEVLPKLGLIPRGGSFKTVKKHAARLGLDTSHFKSGELLMREAADRIRQKRSHAATEFKNLFVPGAHFDTVKRHLPKFKDAHHCAECGQVDIWNGKHLVLQVDHINGDSRDHRLENLRYLCPNCHTQTETFSGKVPKKERHERVRVRRHNPPSGKPPVDWPSDMELQAMLELTPAREIAKTLKVSDVAISKHCKVRGIPKPGRGAWAKKPLNAAIPGPDPMVVSNWP